MASYIPLSLPDDVAFLALFTGSDPRLGDVPVYILTSQGPRPELHIFHFATYRSFTVSLSPTAKEYAAVSLLPTSLQGDETFRGLAFGLFKAFGECSEISNANAVSLLGSSKQSRSGRDEALFDAAHAASIVAKMELVEEPDPVLEALGHSLDSRMIYVVDLNVELPARTITTAENSSTGEVDFGKFVGLIKSLGSPTLISPSALKRASSQFLQGSFSQKFDDKCRQSVARELAELLQTEIRYIDRLDELLNFPTFAGSVKEHPQIETPSEELLPSSIRTIRHENGQFLDDLENIASIYRQEDVFQSESLCTDYISAVASSMVACFPRFRECYQEYISSEGERSESLNRLMRSQDPIIQDAITKIGEQKLRSWFIEPVQRLPRYGLYIDTILQKLPRSHPSFSKFVDAKALINDICDLEGATATVESRVGTRLRSLVRHWPAHLLDCNKPITIVNATSLKPCQDIDAAPENSSLRLILLFKDRLVFLRRDAETSLSARALQAEIDSPSASHPTDARAALSYLGDISLLDLQAWEGHDRRSISFRNTNSISAQTSGREASTGLTKTQGFLLRDPYLGKAHRFHEDIVRVRALAHLSNLQVPEQDVHAFISDSLQTQLTVLSVVREQTTIAEPHVTPDASGVTISFVDSFSSLSPPTTKSTILAKIDSSRQTVRLKTFHGQAALSDSTTGYDTFSSHLRDLLSKLVIHALKAEDNCSSELRYRRSILKMVREVGSPRRVEPPISRSLSPVKALASYFTSSASQSTTTLRGKPSQNPLQAAPTLGLTTSTRLQPILIPTAGAADDSSPIKIVTPLDQLEATLNTYIMALRSRRGNVVGVILRKRRDADEGEVTELYQSLLQDPNNHQAAAEVSVDVLFCAFECFLATAWQRKLGPLLSDQILNKIELALSSPSRQVQAKFNDALYEMMPQSRRGLTAIVEVLGQLLDAAGNDGDKGALIAAFAEAIMASPNCQDFYNILDRLVEEFAVLFDDSIEDSGPQDLQRSRSMNTGSIGSAASSLRRRFNFGLSRESSKSEAGSRSGTLMRGLSRRTNEKTPDQSESQNPSLSRSFLSRSRSTIDVNRSAASRPQSQDRPLTGGSMIGDTKHRPGSSHNSLKALPTVSEHTPRRGQHHRSSSLSDLPVLQDIEPNVQNSVGNTPKKAYERPSSLQQTPSPNVTHRFDQVAKENMPPHMDENMRERPLNLTPKASSPLKRVGTIKQSNSPITSPAATLSPTRSKSVQAITTSPQRSSQLARLESRVQQLEAQSSEGASTSPLSRDILQDMLTEQLQARIAELERNLAAVKTESATKIAQLEKKFRGLDVLYREVNAENELLYERFNMELAKIMDNIKSAGPKETEQELRRQMIDAQDEATKLRKANAKLKRDLVSLSALVKAERGVQTTSTATSTNVVGPSINL